MRVPFYEKATYPRFPVSTTVQSHQMEIIDFLKWVINRDKLEISNYFDKMRQDPFFLVAATGLGKTVGVPIHMLIRQIQQTGRHPNPEPRVWVVEPRIPIAVGQAAFMISLWKDYTSQKGKKNMPPLFGCISSTSGNTNPEAPVKFVTTGIFELMAKDGQLNPNRDRVVIDEAHVTVEQNPGVELGIALARKAGVTIDYMSATVDTANLSESLGVANIINADKQRFTVWKHNLLCPAGDILPDLIAKTLIEADLSSEYFPRDDGFRQAAEVRAAVTESGRSHGMLVVVNSFAGDYSDTQRLAQIIRKAHPGLTVLQLASEVIRDPRRMREYESKLKRIEQDKRNYVILATSVVEMGITFPTLDYVVTMDSGYEQETVGNNTFPVIAPLGVNSLLQRIGRVGRKRPGIAYIANEISADYAELDDEELNSRQSLAYEPIKFPLADSPLTPLAYYACKQGWQDIDAKIADLNLPSKLHANPDRMEYLHEQIANLEKLGLTYNHQLTPLGESMEKWIGQTDLAYAVTLQKCFEEGASLSDVIFWIVATALSETPIVTLRAKYDYFIDRDGSHDELPHSLDVWSHSIQHEDVSAFVLFAEAASTFPQTLWRTTKIAKAIEESEAQTFESWCILAGIDSRKLLQTGKAVRETWRLFSKVNGKSTQYRVMFGDPGATDIGTIPWQTLRNTFPASNSRAQLYELPGNVSVQLKASDIPGKYKWKEHDHEGIVSQDDTPIPLKAGHYVARLTPSREAQGDEAMWRLTHLGQPLDVTPKSASRTEETTQEPTSGVKAAFNSLRQRLGL